MDNTTCTDSTLAVTAVAENMKKYTRYSNNEFLPNNIDGLKLLWRRLLLVLYESNDSMKCTALQGLCMQKYHPHGDQGVEDGIISLGQPFKQTKAWIVIKGNFGAYGGAQAAAGRYLDVYQSPFTKDIFFSNVDLRTLSYTPTEYSKGEEPLYFIPIIPTAFLFGGKRLASGFVSNTPFLNLNDVCDLVAIFIQLRKKNISTYMHKFSSIAKYCIPDFPSKSLIRNKEELVKEYSKGNFNVPVIMDGTMEVEPNGLTIKSIPYGTTQFEDIIIKKLGPMMNSANQVSATANEILDLSTGQEEGTLSIKLKRGINPFEVLETYKKLCMFSQSWSPQWNFVDKDGCVCEMNPLQLLDVWYNARHRSILAGLKFISNDLFKQYRRLMALILIVDHTDEIIKIFKEAENREGTLLPLIKQFGLTREQAEYIASLQLQQITKHGKSELLDALEKVKEQIKENQSKYTVIDETITNEAATIKAKYGKDCSRRTQIPNFLGAIFIREYKGVVQFNSIQELIKLYHRWGKSFDVDIWYQLSNFMAVNFENQMNLCYPKEFMADGLLRKPSEYFGTIRLKSGYIFRTDEPPLTLDPKGITALAEKRMTVVKKGYRLENIDTSDVAKRASSEASGQRTEIVFFNGRLHNKPIVGIVDGNMPNIVILRVMQEGDLYRQPLIGKSKIIGMWEYGEPISLTIPEEYTTRCSTRKLLILNSDKFMGDNKEIQVNFNRKKTSDGRSLDFLHKNAEILSDLNFKGKLEQ